MSDQTDPDGTMYIVNRPLYRVIVLITGDDIDVNIILTAKGKKYARARAYSHHHYIHNDDEAIAEILNARDNYMPPLKSTGKFSFDV